MSDIEDKVDGRGHYNNDVSYRSIAISLKRIADLMEQDFEIKKEQYQRSLGR